MAVCILCLLIAVPWVGLRVCDRGISSVMITTAKAALNGHSQKDQNLVFKNSYRLMQVKRIAESAKLSTVIELCFQSEILTLANDKSFNVTCMAWEFEDIISFPTTM